MKLYVGNLPHSYSDQDLAQLFSAFGTVTSARIIMDRELGRSKGFGFVEFSSAPDAQKAIAELNGTDAGGRAIVVSEARPLEPRSNDRSFGGGGNRGGNGGGGGGNRSFGDKRRSY
jgi:cold-inducible RNA-binding protein